MTNSTPVPGQNFPVITLPLLDGGHTDISKPIGSNDWKLILIYRGKHCPLCTDYLVELETVREEFSEIGIDIIAISADSKDRASSHFTNINRQYPVAYDLSQEQMKALGLHISGPQNGTNVERPFAEPGLFIIDQNGKVQLVDISNVPFARPNLKSVASGMKWLRSRTQEFPINGTFN